MSAVEAGAAIHGEHRYRLWRRWGTNSKTVCFIMLNPSTADATTDDPTIRKCMGFARRWGFGGIEVLNLWSYRATKPKDLVSAGYPNGPAADEYIRRTLQDSEVGAVVYAWGRNAWNSPRPGDVDRIVRDLWKPQAIRLTKDGVPGHPLYLPYTSELFEVAPLDRRGATSPNPHPAPYDRPPP